MNPEAAARERLIGWILAGVAAFHLLILQPREWVMVSSFTILLVGAILRGRSILVPIWLGHAVLAAGIVGVILSPGLFRVSVAGDLAAFGVAALLLLPVTIGRGQWVLIGLLVQLTSLLIKPFPSIGQIFIVADVAVLLILTEQVCRPPEARVNFWVSLMRSLRLIVPVGMIVTLIFWFFPSLAPDESATFTGFSGSGLLDPGNIVELAQSRRVALTAQFPKDQPIPNAGELYWRGQVLEINEGMRWSRISRHFDRVPVLLQDPPPPGERQVSYSQELAANRGGVVPVLDYALYLKAWREGDEITVLDVGGATLTAVGGGPLKLAVTSSLGKLADLPPKNLDQGLSAVPEQIQKNPAIREITARIFAGKIGVIEKLQAMADYLQSSDFRYSSRPGRVGSLEEFLVDRRRGFCEHYAAATANLLRLGGLPARVVTGYRGGSWNPWTRTITVRDSEAHAWVEAWDEGTQQWLRFDPTQFVAPEIDQGVRWEMDSAHWPWYRSLLGFGEAVVNWVSDWFGALWDRLVSPEGWEQFTRILMIVLLFNGAAWLVYANWPRAVSPAESAGRGLARLERRALRMARGRQPGETPLAWLNRLAVEAAGSEEEAGLRKVAGLYEALRYEAAGSRDDALAAFRAQVMAIDRQWRKSRVI